MGRIVVCGGSVIGSCTAAMLARDGHTVTVLEADPDGAPASPADACVFEHAFVRHSWCGSAISCMCLGSIMT